MRYKFNVGDLAVLVSPSAGWEFYQNMIVEIRSELQTLPTNYGHTAAYEVMPREVAPEDKPPFYAHPFALRPIDPGRELGSWDDCVWKPDALKTAEAIAVEIRELNKQAMDAFWRGGE